MVPVGVPRSPEGQYVWCHHVSISLTKNQPLANLKLIHA